MAKIARESPYTRADADVDAEIERRTATLLDVEETPNGEEDFAQPEPAPRLRVVGEGEQ